MKKILLVFMILLLFSFVSAETCQEMDVCDQTCEELAGEVCDAGDLCEGQGITMQDGSLCCTLIGCYSEEQYDTFLEFEYESIEEYEQEELEKQEWPVWAFVLIGFVVLVLIFFVIILLLPKKSLPLKPQSSQQSPPPFKQ
ncbi:hypothetical protein HOD38_00890 [archaeon]|jgi:hypothetical protein|nr:hypothetical protein [archaeon]MBT4396802.1 hypothetical protein [archaeon]MBT4441520.1 hypothetical protein [archaeon]